MIELKFRIEALIKIILTQVMIALNLSWDLNTT